MEEVLAKPKPMPMRMQELVALALANGSRDNITIAAAVHYPDAVPIPGMHDEAPVPAEEPRT
jgi:serine/threonine protein phosphatase PrpC